MQKRAKNVEATRQRIVEAAVELHEKDGPANTSLSSIAERAGVERQTYYRHFPDERSLLTACSGHYMTRNPLPEAGRWREIEDPDRRLRHGLREIYAYYEANEAMLSSVLRDAAVHEMTSEMVSTYIAPSMEDLGVALSAGWARGRRKRAAIELALSFHTWRTLVRESGLPANQAISLMAGAVRCAE
jgi:AcrR family transcriptional regulator